MKAADAASRCQDAVVAALGELCAFAAAAREIGECIERIAHLPLKEHQQQLVAKALGDFAGAMRTGPAHAALADVTASMERFEAQLRGHCG